MGGSFAPARVAYAAEWRRFERWCAGRATTALAAPPAGGPPTSPSGPSGRSWPRLGARRRRSPPPAAPPAGRTRRRHRSSPTRCTASPASTPASPGAPRPPCQRSFKFPQVWSSKIPPPPCESQQRQLRLWALVGRPSAACPSPGGRAAARPRGRQRPQAAAVTLPRSSA